MKTNNVAKTLHFLGVLTIILGLILSIFFAVVLPLILLSSLIFGAILIGLAEIIKLLQEISHKLGPEVVVPLQAVSTLPFKNSPYHSIFIEDANQIKALISRRNETLESIFPTPYVDFHFVATNKAYHLVELGDFVPYVIPKERWKPEMRHFYEEVLKSQFS